MLRHCGCVRDTDACQRPRRDRLRNGGAGGGGCGWAGETFRLQFIGEYRSEVIGRE